MTKRKSLLRLTTLQEYLPEHLLISIYFVLPVKTLVRFRCVCKLWYKIISNNSFINLHLKTSSITTKYLLLDYFNSYSLLRQESNTVYDFTKVRKCDELLKLDDLRGKKLKIYGNCNGLLCLSDVSFGFSSSVYLWNPMIRKVKNIRNAPSSLYDNPGAADLCLGYCDDDYKVINICLMNKKIFHVTDYSLTTDRWEIKTGYCYATDLGSSPCLPAQFVNGAAYFGFYGQIITFDVLDKRIGEIKYPEKFCRDHNNKMEAYGDSLALIGIDLEIGVEVGLSLWVLKNCGNITSSWWEKKVIIYMQTVRDYYPLGFVNNDEYVLMSRRGDVYSYKLESSQLNILSLNNRRDVYQVSPFLESLVLLDEKTIGPAEPEPCSTHPTFTLHKTNQPRKILQKHKGKKRKVEGLQWRRNENSSL